MHGVCAWRVIRSVVVTGLKEVPVTSAEAMAACLAEGFKHRATSGTKMNAQSSRSHAIFSIVVEQTTAVTADSTDAAADAVLKVSKFHLVDLAGRYCLRSRAHSLPSTAVASWQCERHTERAQPLTKTRPHCTSCLVFVCLCSGAVSGRRRRRLRVNDSKKRCS